MITTTTTDATDVSVGRVVAEEIAKTTAAYCGVFIGFAVTGLAMQKVQSIKARRAAKNETPTED